MMQLSALERKLLPGERGGDERPAEKHTAKRKRHNEYQHSLAVAQHRGAIKLTPKRVSLRDSFANCAPKYGEYTASIIGAVNDECITKY